MKINRKKFVIAGILLVSIAAVSYFLKMQVDKIPGKALLKIMSDEVDLQVKNVHYTDVSDKGSKWEVSADTVRYIRNGNRALFDKVTIKLILLNGKEYVLHADKGDMKTDTNDMTVSGNVVVVSNNGDRFTTDYLEYSDSLRQFQTDAPVEMGNQRTKIKGVGMKLSLNDESASILSGVKAVIR
jgi:LPS export ABC transporter protein LptC